MAGKQGGVVHIPWYATFGRGDELEEGLLEIAPVALRYGASHYDLTRMRDDRHKILQTAVFADPFDFDRYWYGNRFNEWRAIHSSYYQVPALYYWADKLAEGVAAVESVGGGATVE